MRYHEVTPPPVLLPYVRCVWVLQADDPRMAFEPVVPDGLLELTFNLAQPILQRQRAEILAQPRDLVVGQMTTPTFIAPTGTLHVLGIRLYPWAALPLFGVRASDLSNSIFSADTVSLDAHRALREAAESSESDHRRIIAVIEELERRLSHVEPVDATVVALTRLLSADTASVTSAAAALGRSVRWVQRVLQEQVGLQPKMLVRITRVQRALRFARSEKHGTWAEIAASAGYYDQSHLIRDFREIVGCIPGDVAAAGHELTAAFLSRE